jgi:hypothetical protein
MVWKRIITKPCSFKKSSLRQDMDFYTTGEITVKDLSLESSNFNAKNKNNRNDFVEKVK